MFFFNFYTKKLKTIEPFSSSKRIWDFIIFFILFIDAFYTPMKIIFLVNSNNSYNLFENILIILVSIDIVINLNTAFYFKGAFISEKPKVFKNYIKEYLLIDIFIYLQKFLFYNKLNWLKYVRIVKAKSSLNKINENFHFTQYRQALFDLIKLISLIIYLGHLCGCAYFELAILQNSEQTWLHSKNLINVNWQSQYINSLYFAVVTIITVGFGDVHPQNDVEKVFTIFIMIFSWISFGFILNSIGQILSEMLKEGKILK